ncbi:hypothetical protein [Brunnivagina elsteri]|uniref:hypothetical protein n=1 Tax=Brunnivagina elsteri TaxID=1247191 RepID=UPI00130425FE|nr:hypothetical protein [Calothrix elsteri]
MNKSIFLFASSHHTTIVLSLVRQSPLVDEPILQSLSSMTSATPRESIVNFP